MDGKVYLVATLIAGCLLTQACRETVRETEVREIQVEQPRDDQEDPGVFERTGDRIDQEIDEEIDSAIDDIGDDN